MCDASCYIYKVPRVKSSLPVRGGFSLHVCACDYTPKNEAEL